MLFNHKRKIVHYMKIIKLEITNYKGIKNLKIENPPDLLILIGTNGSGKSSVLTALNEILKYCLGARNDYPIGIKLTLDLNDHINDIKIWFETNFSDSDKATTFFSHSGMLSQINDWDRLERFTKYFLEDILPIFIKSPILEFQDGSAHYTFANNINNEEIENVGFKYQYYPKKDFGYGLGVLVHLWLKLRANYNSTIPGVAYLNTENINIRNALITQSVIKVTFDTRIQNLKDQKCMTNHLGTRIV